MIRETRNEKRHASFRGHGPAAEVRDALISLGLDPFPSTPREYADVLKAGLAWNVNAINVLKKKGVKFDS